LLVDMRSPEDLAAKIVQLAQDREHARRLGLGASVWQGGPAQASTSCLIVQRAGALADLYALGTLAYVGGGMGSHGLHAVIEPAAYAVPVIVGPRGHRADAGVLVQSGGAVALPRRQAARALARWWETWLAGACPRGPERRRRSKNRDTSAGADGSWLTADRRWPKADYCPTTHPSKDTLRGEIRPTVRPVISKSVNRARTRMRRFATDWVPVTCPARARSRDGLDAGTSPHSR